MPSIYDPADKGRKPLPLDHTRQNPRNPFNFVGTHKIHLELTQRCQAMCPMCDRCYGGTLNKHLSNADLPLDLIRSKIPHKFIQRLSSVLMCGNFGDPIFHPDLLGVVDHFASHGHGAQIRRVVTNGGYRDPSWWSDLAKTKTYVTFSIDGLEDTNHIYRKNVKWESVMRSATAFNMAGGKSKWVFLVFKHNEHQIEEARELSRKMGFEAFTVKKSARFVSPVNMDRKDFDEIQPPDNPRYRNDAVENFDPSQFEGKIRCRALNLDNKRGTIREKSRLGNNEIFISALGEVLPCCWLGSAMYKTWEGPRENDVWKLIDKVGYENILLENHSLKSIVNGKFYEELGASWKTDPVKMCKFKCNEKFDGYGEQFK